MSSSGEDHTASMGIDPSGGYGDIQSGDVDVFDEEAVQFLEHVDEWHATAQVGCCLRVNSVRDQRGTDAVTGNITDEQAEVLAVQRVHQREISPNRMHRMIERVDAHFVPHQGARREAPLDARGEPEVFLDLHLAFLKFYVGGTELLLGAHLL